MENETLDPRILKNPTRELSPAYFRKRHIMKLATLLFAFAFPFTSFAQPVITSFTPLSAPPGTTVTINGNNFNASPANNIVYFGAARANVLSATNTVLTVAVPTGATYAPVTVTDTVAKLTAFSLKSFNLTFPFSCEKIDSTFFSHALDTTTANKPNYLTICDFDLDGKTDIAVPNYYVDSVSIFANVSTTGSLALASPVMLFTGVNPFEACAGDLNGDGKPELIVTNRQTATFAVYVNTSTVGAISFLPKVVFAAPYLPEFITVNDVDGDGKPDVIVDEMAAGKIAVYPNTCTGNVISFGQPLQMGIVSASAMTQSFVRDMDGDGKVDIVAANHGTGDLNIWLNTSSPGNLSVDSVYLLPVSSAPTLVSAVDLDNDGKLDIAVGRNGALSLFRNTSSIGSLSFGAQQDFNTFTQHPVYIVPGDINGDGKTDLSVTFNVNPTWVGVYQNISSSSIALDAPVNFTTSPGLFLGAAAGDIDGDGKPELVLSEQFGKYVTILQNQCPSPLSIATENDAAGISVAPNPFSETTTIQFETEQHNTTLRVYNTLGACVSTVTFSGNTCTLKREGWSAGVYLLRIVQEEKTVYKKMVVN